MKILGLMVKSLLRVAMLAAIVAVAVLAYLPIATSLPKGAHGRMAGDMTLLINHSKEQGSQSVEDGLKVAAPGSGLSSQTLPSTTQQPSANPQQPVTGTEPDQLPCYDCPSGGATTDQLCPDNCPVIDPTPKDSYCPPCGYTELNGKKLIMCPMMMCRALDDTTTYAP